MNGASRRGFLSVKMTICIKIVRNNATNWFESFSFDTENIGNATGFNNMTFFFGEME